MKYITNFIITALLLFCTDLWAQDHVGFLKKVSGDVEIQRGDSFVNAHRGFKLMNADVLITGSIGYAGVVFTDGTTVAIGPDSEFNIRNYRFNPDVKAYDFSMYLKNGSAIYNSGKIGKLSPTSVNISTPRAIVGVRGTRFIIKVD